MLSKLFTLRSSGGRLPILIYHQVMSGPDPMRTFEITAAEFDNQISWLKRYLRPISLYHGLKDLDNGCLQPGSVAITFDDGYKNNYEIALPILKQYSVPATFFIASGFLDGGIMWNDCVIESFRAFPSGTRDLSSLGLGCYELNTPDDRLKSAFDVLSKLKHQAFEVRAETVAKLGEGLKLPDNLMLTSSDVKALADEGMEIGGHTIDHPILANLQESEIERQIVDNKRYLESIVGRPIKCFAYPNGKPAQDYNLKALQCVKAAGYEFAVSTSVGVGEKSTDPYQFPRYTPWRRQKFPFLFQLWRNYSNKPAYV